MFVGPVYSAYPSPHALLNVIVIPCIYIRCVIYCLLLYVTVIVTLYVFIHLDYATFAFAGWCCLHTLYALPIAPVVGSSRFVTVGYLTVGNAVVPLRTPRWVRLPPHLPGQAPPHYRDCRTPVYVHYTCDSRHLLVATPVWVYPTTLLYRCRCPYTHDGELLPTVPVDVTHILPFVVLPRFAVV